MKVWMKVWGLLLCAAGLPVVAQAQTHTKIETIQYHDDLSLWVLGQVERTTTNGIETSRTEYGWKASPTKTYAFGKLQQTIGYNTSDGTVSHVVDGKNNLTILRSWMRGIPRQIEYADGYSQYATVNDSGWITSVTDENGYVTGYGYDAMGRLNRIDYPSGDSTNWDTTWRYFEQINEEEYGLAPGHWRLKNRRLKHIIAALVTYRQSRTAHSLSTPDKPPMDLLLRSASAFRRARRYVPIETSCLLDSVAMVRFLARRQLFANLVFGVTHNPFAAHCWVQTGDWVLNDTVGNVVAHTPIREV